MAPDVPESRAALEQIGAFVRERGKIAAGAHRRMPARSGQHTSKRSSACRPHLPQRTPGQGRDRGACIRRPIKSIAELYDLQLDPATATSCSTSRRPPATRCTFVPDLEDAAGANQQAQGVQAAHRPQLRLHGPDDGLHEQPGHRLVPEPGALARRGATSAKTPRATTSTCARTTFFSPTC